jgi:tetratricopeptide (TPR) repeat protein/HEAT repeat protein
MVGQELKEHLVRCAKSSVEELRLSTIEAAKYLGQDGEDALVAATYLGMGESYYPSTSVVAMQAAVEAGMLKPLISFSEGRPGPVTWEFMRGLLDMGEPGWKIASQQVHDGCPTILELAIEAARRLGPSGIPALSSVASGGGDYGLRMVAIDTAVEFGADGLPVMEAALRSYGDELNIHAIKALAKLPNGLGVGLMMQNYYIGNQSSPKGRAVLEAAATMGLAGLPVLEHALCSYETNEWLGKAAAEAIARTGDESAAVFSRLIETVEPHIRVYIMHGAGFLAGAGVPILMKALGDPNAPVHEVAVEAAGRIGDPAADIIMRAAKEGSSRASYAAATATKNLKERELEVIQAFLEGPSEYSSMVVGQLVKYKEKAVPLLHKALVHYNINTRAEAARCAGELGDLGLELLEIAIKDTSSYCPQFQICDYYGPQYHYQLVKFAAIQSAAKIGPKARHIVELGFKDEDSLVRLSAAPYMGPEGIELLRTNLNTARGPKVKRILHDHDHPEPEEIEVEPSIVPAAHRAFAVGALATIAKDQFDLITLAYTDPTIEVKVAAVQSAGKAGPQGLEILSDAFNTGSWDLTNASINSSASLGKDAMPFLRLVAQKGDYYQIELAIPVARALGTEAMPFFEDLMAIEDTSRFRPEARIALVKFVRTLGPSSVPFLKMAIGYDMIDCWAGPVAKEAWEASIEWGDAGLPILLAAPKFDNGLLTEAIGSGKFGTEKLKDHLLQAFDNGDEKEKLAILRAVTAWGDEALVFLPKAFGNVPAEEVAKAALRIGKSSINELDKMLVELQQGPDAEQDPCPMAAIKEALYRLDGPQRFHRTSKRSMEAQIALMNGPDVDKKVSMLQGMDAPLYDWIPVVYIGVTDPHKKVRAASIIAAEGLGRAGLPALLFLAMDPDQEIQSDAISRMSGPLGDELKVVLAEAWYYKGIALRETGDYDGAVEAFDNIKLDDNIEPIMLVYEKAQAHLGAQRFEEALALFEKVLVDSPEDGKTWYNKGCVLLAMGRNEEAITANDTALKYNPSDNLAWGNKGSALMKLGRFEEAVAAFDKNLEIDGSDVNALYNKGSALDRLGKFSEAVAPLEKAAGLSPTHASVYNELGIAHQNLDQNDAAFAAFDKALQADPNHVNARVNKGVLLSKLGRNDEALTVLDEALKVQPNSLLALFNRGVIFELLGRNDEAIVTFDKVLTLDPNDGSAIYCKARLFAMKGSKDEALTLLARAIELIPGTKVEARDDKAFVGLHDEERFKRLVE